MTGTKKIAMFGSAAALAFAVSFGGVGASALGNTPTEPPCASRGTSARPRGAQRALRPFSPAAYPASTAASPGAAGRSVVTDNPTACLFLSRLCPHMAGRHRQKRAREWGV